MFAQKNRLHTANKIRSVMRRGRFHRLDKGLQIQEMSVSGENKVAVIVGKKFAQSAVRRNKQRRILIAALKTVLKDKQQKYNIVVTNKSSREMVSYKEAKQLFQEKLR